MKKTGLVIMIVGALFALLVIMDFTFTTREKVVDVGDLQIHSRKKHSIPWSPYVGLAIMAVGGGMYLLSSKRSLLH